jgi:hypothetical protein
MNEEQHVLDFFAQAENFPLGLAVAEQMDRLREQTNIRLWRELLPRLNALIKEHELAWHVELTEDKNAPDSLVGLHCTMRTEQPLYLRPMMEQQYLGNVWRIYFGLMWSAAPSPDQLGLHDINKLKESLQQAGFKNNENFLAWQWTTFHPRRKDFLLRYSLQPEKLLGEMEVIFKTLLIDHRELIEQANVALKNAPHSTAISLDKLRSKRGV